MNLVDNIFFRGMVTAYIARYEKKIKMRSRIIPHVSFIILLKSKYYQSPIEYESNVEIEIFPTRMKIQSIRWLYSN